MERVILHQAGIKFRAIFSRFLQKKLDTDCKIYLENAFIAAPTPSEVGLRGRSMHFLRHFTISIKFFLLKSTKYCSKINVCLIQYNSFHQ